MGDERNAATTAPKDTDPAKVPFGDPNRTANDDSPQSRDYISAMQRLEAADQRERELREGIDRAVRAVDDLIANPPKPGREGLTASLQGLKAHFDALTQPHVPATPPGRATGGQPTPTDTPANA